LLRCSSRASSSLGVALATPGVSKNHPVLLTPFGDCMGLCWNADGSAFCTSYEPMTAHEAIADTAHLFFGGEPHGCEENGPCCGGDECYHPECEVGEESPDLEQIRSALLGDRLPLIRAMVSEFDRVVLNSERSALQVLGCSGDVVAHLPLNDRQLMMLAQ